MFDLTPGGLLFASMCAIVVGMSKCGIPGGGSLAVPLMASVLPAKVATGALLPMLIAGDCVGAVCFRRHADIKLLLKLLPVSIAGIWAGYVALGWDWMDDTAIRRTTGVIVVLLTVMSIFSGKLKELLAGETVRSWKKWTMAVLFGFLAGFTTMLANAAGPVALIYFLALDLKKDEFISTNAWFFVVLNWLKVPFMVERGMITLESLQFNLRLAPGLYIGCILGFLVSRRLSNDVFKRCMQALTILAALQLLLPKGFVSSLFRQFFQ